MLKYILLGLSLATQLAAQSARYVDPMLGADAGGNTFPGASLPFGMVKPGPDRGSNQSNAGWEPSGNINSFSQTHVSGTGGGPKYGKILVQPTTGAPQGSNYGSPRTGEQASAGYYSVTLSRCQIAVEITTAAGARPVSHYLPRRAAAEYPVRCEPHAQHFEWVW